MSEAEDIVLSANDRCDQENLLAQLYGGRHRFEMMNAPEGGLTVLIGVPFHTA